MAMKQMSELPNQHGFEFIGVTKKGALNRDRVIKDAALGYHRVESRSSREYIGWFSIAEYEAAQREQAPLRKKQPKDVKAGCFSV